MNIVKLSIGIAILILAYVLPVCQGYAVLTVKYPTQQQVRYIYLGIPSTTTLGQAT